jgi:hypothetical protein
MLKKAPSGVLALKASSTYPEGTPPVLSSAAALLEDLFEHPETESLRWKIKL